MSIIANKNKVTNALIDYFDYEESSLLTILDEEVANPDALERGGYTGVTMGYLFKYVIPGCTEQLFIEVVNELIQRKIMAYIPCSDINKIVFEKYITDNDHYRGALFDKVTYKRTSESNYYIYDEEE